MFATPAPVPVLLDRFDCTNENDCNLKNEMSIGCCQIELVTNFHKIQEIMRLIQISIFENAIIS